MLAAQLAILERSLADIGYPVAVRRRRRRGDGGVDAIGTTNGGTGLSGRAGAKALEGARPALPVILARRDLLP